MSNGLVITNDMAESILASLPSTPRRARPRRPVPPRGAVTVLRERHREMLRRIVAGESNKQISEEMGVSPSSVSVLRNSPSAQAHIETLEKEADEKCVEARSRLRLLTTQAVEHLAGALEDPALGGRSVEQADRIALAVLDRSGLGPVTRGSIKTQVAHGHFTLEDIEKLEERAQAEKNSSYRQVVDVTPADRGE